MIVSISVK